jgi:hypothetical protein
MMTSSNGYLRRSLPVNSGLLDFPLGQSNLLGHHSKLRAHFSYALANEAGKGDAGTCPRRAKSVAEKL